MLQFLNQWLDRDPAASAPHWQSSSAAPPTAWANCTVTWNGSSSCSAAATASSSSAHDLREPSWSPEPTPGHAGLNVVRPRAGALWALRVDPPQARALTSAASRNLVRVIDL